MLAEEVGALGGRGFGEGDAEEMVWQLRVVRRMKRSRGSLLRMKKEVDIQFSVFGDQRVSLFYMKKDLGGWGRGLNRYCD